jgi:hypothetical protein
MSHSQAPGPDDQKTADRQSDRAPQQTLPSPTVTEPWHAADDPQALRRLLLARLSVVQHRQRKAIRRQPSTDAEILSAHGLEPRRPPAAAEGPPTPPGDEHEPHGDRNHLEPQQLVVDHHDFSSRFRER